VVRRYGDLASFRAGPARVYVVGHPDLAREVLETAGELFPKGSGSDDAKRLLGEGLLVSSGEMHEAERRRLDPLFTAELVPDHAGTVVAQAERLGARWRDGATIDAFDDMLDTTSKVIMRTLTGHLDEEEAARIARALATTAGSFWRLFLPFSRTIDRSPLRGSRRFREAREAVDAFLYERIAAVHAGAGARDGLLADMVGRPDPATGEPMSDFLVRSESLNLFLAARATTATGITWTWYLLSQHPEIEARFHAELDEVLGDGAPAREDLPRLRYTRMVFAESLRVYPPAWILKRQASADHLLGEWTVPAGANVLVSPYVIHHDPRFFLEPDRFDPERMAPEGLRRRHRYAYFPFGGGAQGCIGHEFAWMEGPLILATLGRRWRLRHVPGHRVALSPKVTLKPRYGMRMTVHARG
jgi:cytochrome P450